MYTITRKNHFMHQCFAKTMVNRLCCHFVSTAKDPPPPVDYLDCEQTKDGSFSLKWCLPQTGEVHITNSILEMKDASGEWKPVYGPTQGSSFIFQGNIFVIANPISSASLVEWLSNL